MGLAGFAVAVLGTFGWLAIRKDDRPSLPSLRPTPAAANGAGDGPSPVMPPPPMLRTVALMSGQKPNN